MNYLVSHIRRYIIQSPPPIPTAAITTTIHFNISLLSPFIIRILHFYFINIPLSPPELLLLVKTLMLRKNLVKILRGPVIKPIISNTYTQPIVLWIQNIRPMSRTIHPRLNLSSGNTVRIM